MSIERRSRFTTRSNFSTRREAAVQLGRGLRFEPLEDRRVLAPVSWDGGGDGVNWSDPINWSGDALPNSADDVTISVGGTITVTHASGSTTIRSVTSDENLTISGGSLTVTNGASNINGDFSVGNLASLTANGATATFTANAAATINGANLFATGGGQLNLVTATSYAEQSFNLTSIQANGAGSKIDLSGVTSVTGTNGALSVNALAGGTIEIDSLISTTARDLNFNVDGATSVLDLSALTSASDTSLLNSLTLANGGTLIAPVLATYSGGSIVVNNMSATLSSLTNINSSSLFTGTAGILSLPNVTSYTEPPFANAVFQANGAGSKIDLSGVTSLTGTNGALSVNALAGGTIEI
ncbi:MAG: hypothetical protein WD845_17730, partial [Pirellulales bacterium]